MRWLGRGLVLLVLGAACASLKPTPAPEKTASDAPDETAAAADASAFLEVRDVRVAPVGAGRRITIVLSREPEGMQDFWLASPPRLVVDLTGPRAENPPTVATYPFPDEVVSQVRVGAHGGSLRAVIDLARNPGAHAVRREGLTLIADLGDTSVAGAEAPAAAEAVASPEPPAPAPIAEAPAEPAPSPWLAVRDVKIEPAGAGRRLTIWLTRSPDRVRNFVLESPPRLVIDLAGPNERSARLARFPLTDPVVSRVRAAANGESLRVVVDLREQPGPHLVRQEGSRLIADLGDTGQAAAPPSGDDLSLIPAVASEPIDVAPVAHRSDVPQASPMDEAPVQIAQAADTPPQAVSDATPEPQARLSMPSTRRPKSYLGESQVLAGQRISLDFKDADIQNVLRVLADVSGLNIIATDDVQGQGHAAPERRALGPGARPRAALEPPREDPRRQRRPHLDGRPPEGGARGAARGAGRRARARAASRELRQGELRARRRRPRRQGEGRAHGSWQRHLRRAHQHDHRARHPARHRRRDRS